jgi:superfamily II DNA or RNA helicase
MVNFKKALEKKDSKQRLSPMEIYDNLDRVASVGPLRPIQEDVLTTWYKDYADKKDVIIKLREVALCMK